MSELKGNKKHLFGELTEEFIRKRDEFWGGSRNEAVNRLGAAAVQEAEQDQNFTPLSLGAEAEELHSTEDLSDDPQWPYTEDAL